MSKLTIGLVLLIMSSACRTEETYVLSNGLYGELWMDVQYDPPTGSDAFIFSRLYETEICDGGGCYFVEEQELFIDPLYTIATAPFDCLEIYDEFLCDGSICIIADQFTNSCEIDITIETIDGWVYNDNFLRVLN